MGVDQDLNQTEAVASFADQLTYDDIPDEVVAIGKRAFLDHLSCILLGSQEYASEIMADYVGIGFPGDDATVLQYDRQRDDPITSKTASPFGAALTHGAYATSLEFDHGISRAAVHPGGTVLPALLAVGEREQVTGKDFLTAMIAGYEIGGRYGYATAPESMHQGYYATAPNGVFGPAIAVGKLLGLDQQGLVDALGIAGNLSPTSLLETSVIGGTVKNTYMGWTSAIGITSAELAREGITGHPDIGEEWGRVVMDAWKDDRFMDELGEDFPMTKSVRIKSRQGVGPGLVAVKPTVKLLQENDIDLDDIQQVTVQTSSRSSKLTDMATSDPGDIYAARMNPALQVAAVIVRFDEVTDDMRLLEFWNEDILDDDRIFELMEKVTFEDNEEYEAGLEANSVEEMKFMSNVIIETSMNTYEKEYDVWETAAINLTNEYVHDMFHEATSIVLDDPETIEAIIEFIMDIESAENMETLFTTITA